MLGKGSVGDWEVDLPAPVTQGQGGGVSRGSEEGRHLGALRMGRLSTASPAIGWLCLVDLTVLPRASALQKEALVDSSWAFARSPVWLDAECPSVREGATGEGSAAGDYVDLFRDSRFPFSDLSCHSLATRTSLIS